MTGGRGGKPDWARVIVLLSMLGLVLGWQVFRFVCDDAFIDFRYVANAHAGYGLVWNLPPFQPVEGYTSLGWVLVLWAAWALTGYDPVHAADWLGLLFATGTLLQTARWALRFPLGRRKPLVLALVMLGTLSNRTFLAWTSSGLETPLWVFLLVSWTEATWHGRKTQGAWAAALALTRPDGALFAAATFALGVHSWLALGRPARKPGALLGLLPLLVIPAHLAWRHAMYGFWVPNTAYAKVAGAWPEAGVRYAAAFVLEYGWWVGALVGGAAFLVLRPRLRVAPGPAAAVCALGAHVAWYTLWVGGDHFEFRIYAHLVPLLWLALAGALGHRAIGVPALLGQLAVSLPIPWTHFALSQGMGMGEAIHEMVVPVAPALPAPLSWMAEPWDDLEAWLIPHYVGIRHQEHKAYGLKVQYFFGPRRARVPSLDAADVPVFTAISIGAAGWMMPDVAVVDLCGLVDAVESHNPDLRPGQRMAHQRQPPKGYVECFAPDVMFVGDHLGRERRSVPLTAADVTECERVWWGKAGLELPAPRQ